MYVGFRKNKNGKWFTIECTKENAFVPGDVYTDPSDMNAYYVNKDGDHIVADDNDLMRFGIGQVGMHERDDQE